MWPLEGTADEAQGHQDPTSSPELTQGARRRSTARWALVRVRAVRAVLWRLAHVELYIYLLAAGLLSISALEWNPGRPGALATLFMLPWSLGLRTLPGRQEAPNNRLLNE